jgi:hypothetical protein
MPVPHLFANDFGAIEREFLDENFAALQYGPAINVQAPPYGAKGDGVTDDTSALQKAISDAGAGFDGDWFSTEPPTSPRVVNFPGGVYRISAPLLVPRGVILKGNNSTLKGGGIGAGDTDGFTSAYYSGGVLTSNVGTPPESHRLQFSRVESFRFVNLRTAVNFYNANEGCAVRDCAFFNVRQALVAVRCFYAEFSNLMNRGAAAGELLPCFVFSTFVNVENIRNVSVIDRVNSVQIDGGVNGCLLTGVTCESCTNGIRFAGEVNPLNIDSCYFENLAAGGVALDFTDANAHRALTIDNNWFSQGAGATGIKGVQMLGGRIGAGNYFLNMGTRVDVQDAVSTITVELPPARMVNGLPSMPAGYALGASLRIVFPLHAYDSGSGLSLVRQEYASGLTPLPFSGRQGFVPTNVAFCTVTASGTTTLTGTVDTRIAFDAYVMCAYALSLNDNNGSYYLAGRVFGANVAQDVVAAGKGVAASNNGGFLRLTLTGFSHPGGFLGCEGVVRMV